MTPLTRREFLRVGGTVAFFGLLTYLGMGRVQKTFSRFHPFLAGLDFEAYAPQVQVDGRFVESVGNWASNTIPTDFISWLNGMYGNAISFRPYQGDLANLRANTLEEVLQRGEGYIRELAKMGASTMIMDPHRALIIGPTPLFGKEVTSYDIRSGMAMVVAALVAKGHTTLLDVEHLDRGYEKLEERLTALGAQMERVE